MSKLNFFFCKQHIVTVAIRPGCYQGCKWNFPRSIFLRLLQKLKLNEDFYRYSFAWCCDIAVNCMELSNTRNQCWLFCDSWIQCICSSKWIRVLLLLLLLLRRQQQYGWETKLWYLVKASGSNKHQCHSWRVYLNYWYLSPYEMLDRD